MAGLERSCAASSEKAWLWKMVSRPLMPGDALASAAEARHHMMCHRAETDHEVGLGRRAVDGDRRAVRRGAEIDKIRRFTIVVFNPDALVDCVRHQRAQLPFVAAAVGK